MNIQRASLTGTKITQIDVPENPWTKITTIPTVPNTDPTNYPTLLKAAGVYNGKIYEVDGNREYGRQYAGTVPSPFSFHIYNGTSWSTSQTSIQPPGYEFDWYFDAGSATFVEYNGKLYLFNFVGQEGGGSPFCYTFDGTSWSSLTPSNNSWPRNISCAVVKDSKLYLFTTWHTGSAWSANYKYFVYSYDSTTNELTLVNNDAFNAYAESINLPYTTGGFRQVVYYNNKYHCIGKDGYVHIMNPDTWQIESSTKVAYRLCELIVYKNKLHAFGHFFEHYVYNSVAGTWSSAESLPYQANPSSGDYKPIRAIIYKNKLHVIGIQNISAAPYPDNDSYDEIYRYNR